MQLIISGIWIHRQGTVLCSISSWNLEHELSWVISQDNCCIRAQDFSLSSRLWHLHTLGFSEHQQLTAHQFCLSCQETDRGCYRVVCMSPVRGLVRVVHPVNDAQLLPTGLKAGTFCEWVGSTDVSTISPKTLCAGILVLSSGTSFFGRCYSWKVYRVKAGTNHFKPSWLFRSFFAVWSCKMHWDEQWCLSPWLSFQTFFFIHWV